MADTKGYADIAEHLRDRIRNGALRPGDRLPTIREVMREHGVSNVTAVRAYRLLKAEGLTSANTGSGTVVADPGSTNASGRSGSYAATGRALTPDETSDILETGRTVADEDIAGRLEIGVGDPVYVRRRLVRRNGVPTHTSASFYEKYVVDATPELMGPVSTGGSKELAAKRLGSPLERSLEEVTSRVATEQERDVLGLAEGAIVTQVNRTVYLEDGRVVEAAVKVVPGTLVLQWSSKLG